MEEMTLITDQMVDEIINVSNETNLEEQKVELIIEPKRDLTVEERMYLEAIKKIKNPFKMIGVEVIMKDLNVCRTIGNRIFNRPDFPSINVGKSNQIMLIAYLVWKMTKRV